MSARKLGRGLDSLIRKTEDPPTSESQETDLEVRQLDPRQIRVNRAQPRTHFDDQALRELSASIKNEGILQPLVVRPDDAGGFELVAGERRLRASLSLRLETVPVIVQSIDPERLLRLALIENIQREDLNPVELALAYRELQKVNEWTQEQVAEKLGKKRSSVANSLRFLDLEAPVRDALASGRLSAGHAKLLLSVEDGKERIALFERAVEDGWTVRRLDQEIRERRGAPPPKKSPGKASARGGPAKKKDPQLKKLEEELGRALGTKVEIDPRGGEKGRIAIDYFSAEDLTRICRQIHSGSNSKTSS